MPHEPNPKRVVSFIDGQNLFHAAREAFGYVFPNYDALALSQAIVAQHPDWQLTGTRFYTGIPDPTDSPHWNQFWSRKLLAMSRTGVYTFSRPLRYRNKRVTLPDGSTHTFLAGEEKGIDVRLALEVTRLAYRDKYDVALIFSQDQDLSEVAEEVRVIGRDHDRWIKVASAFPVSPTSRNRRGINRTDWIQIDRPTYDACIDPRDYRRSTSP